MKTPTVLKYDDTGRFKWGYELDTCLEEKIMGIKLLLDPDHQRPLFDTKGATATQSELQKLGKPLQEVLSDYISAIYQHSLAAISAKFPKGYILTSIEKQLVLSVPAVWSDKAKDITLRAARNAGLNPIELIKEPEAAALFTLNYMNQRGLDKGDAITICDAGGGTVDLVSYEILNINPLELKEVASPTGGIAGSLIINNRFEEWVKSKVGERKYIDLKQTNGYRKAMNDFNDTVKPGFHSKDDPEQHICFPLADFKPDPSDKSIRGDTLILSGNDLYRIFEPVYSEVKRLVNEQIQAVKLRRLQDQHPKGKDIKAIFLVGGLGSNTCIKELLTTTYPDIQVIQPNDAWAAIAKGAVMSKLPQGPQNKPPDVVTTAEKSYGVSAAMIYDEVRDEGREKMWDQWEEKDRCAVMNWYIYKYDNLRRDRKLEFPFYHQLPANPRPADFSASYELLMCDNEHPPVHPDPTVSANCTLDVDLSSVPKNMFIAQTRQSDKVQYQVLNFRLLIKVESARLVFTFECGGKEYSSVYPKKLGARVRLLLDEESVDIDHALYSGLGAPHQGTPQNESHIAPILDDNFRSGSAKTHDDFRAIVHSASPLRNFRHCTVFGQQTVET
ncbi:hypothetical protein AnigIFM49718_000717 [Aspergillus niger]|nr:hypothetical protein AnigIFM49718_000717 [Aspergillus niger]